MIFGSSAPKRHELLGQARVIALAVLPLQTAERICDLLLMVPSMRRNEQVNIHGRRPFSGRRDTELDVRNEKVNVRDAASGFFDPKQ